MANLVHGVPFGYTLKTAKSDSLVSERKPANLFERKAGKKFTRRNTLSIEGL